MRNLTSQVLCSTSWLFPVLEDFFPRRTRRSPIFPGTACTVCLIPRVYWKKKGFVSSFQSVTCRAPVYPQCHGDTPLLPPTRHRQILTALPFILLSHRCSFLQNGHLTPINVPSAFRGAQGHSIVLSGACPGDLVAPRWLGESTSCWRQPWSRLPAPWPGAEDARMWIPGPHWAPRPCIGSGST